MRFDILTLFPEIFDGYLGQSLLKLSIARGLVEVHRWNIRDWTTDRHRKVDDRPYGGGPGMVMMPGPIFDCVEEVQRKAEPGLLVSMTPQGERWTQDLVAELASVPRVLLLCGRYEGFDERVRIGLQPREISVGDFVCNGGEVPAMVVIDTVIRLIPGVLGHEGSAQEDSFSRPGWIEYPQYTRPPEFRGMKVPDVLIGGHHAEIARWREEQAKRRSEQRQRREKG
ncbi:MAG: tRNA (guanosine(37)-N1)-methyltransferase TrmD [Planctomycetota bacterium]